MRAIASAAGVSVSDIQIISTSVLVHSTRRHMMIHLDVPGSTVAVARLRSAGYQLHETFQVQAQPKKIDLANSEPSS
jgi:hypothetical protein